MATLTKMILDDPESFHILTTDIKEKIIEAAINKVNIQVAMARKKAVDNIRDNFTLRNSWTARQIKFTQMPKGRYSLSAIQATIGATEDAAYMERQEMGGRREPMGSRRNLAIPTLVARGGNLGSTVKRQYLTSNLRRLRLRGALSNDGAGTRSSRQVARVAVAYRERKLVRFGENLFFVDSFEARDGRVSFTTRMLYNMDRPYTMTPANPWLLPAVEAAANEGERIFAQQMRKAGL